MSAHQLFLNPNINLTPISPVDRQFHLLVQQSSIGLNINPMLAGQPLYRDNLDQLKKQLPEWLDPDYNKTFDYLINYPYKGQFIKSKLDLLIANETKANIHYWRALQPVNEKTLTSYWPTRQDLWLITNSLKYKPKQVQINYWFLTQFKLVKVTVKYTSELHHEFTEILNNYCCQKNSIKPEENLLELAFQGKITWEQYIDSIPEYPI